MVTPDHRLHGETDEDLLVWMSLRGDDPELAKDACGEFYGRHAEYLYARLGKYWQSLGEHAIEDIVMNAFKRAYEKAGTYQPIGSSSGDAGRRNVRAWLGKIAHHLLCDELERPESSIRLVGEWEPYETSIIPPDRSSVSEDDQLIEAALATLSAKERRVIDVTMQHYAAGAENQRLPNGVAEDLAKALGTTAVNIRQIRKRALEKLRKFILAKEISLQRSIR